MKNWTGQRVLILGAARQGLALARYLATQGAEITVNDQRTAEQLAQARQSLADLNVQWVFDSHPIDLLDRADRVFVSGGVPLELPILVEAGRRGMPVSNDSQVFMEAVPCPTIGITGSAGKTTTTTLVGRMAQAGVPAPRKVWVGGNIGQPLVTFVDEMKADDLVVLELSSFQLEQMTVSPEVSAILNITPNHLDRHGTMETYAAAKARILRFQTDDNTAVLGRDDASAWALAGQVKGRLVSFGMNKPAPGSTGTFTDGQYLYLQNGDETVNLMPASLIELRGAHNRMNVLAACAIAYAAGLPVEAMQAGVTGFRGVAHRLEFVRSWGGADWYNDSIATAPERTMAAIRSFDEPLVLLLGGRDKNLPWESLATLVHQRVDHLIVFGEAAGKILAAVGPQQEGQKPYTITHCAGLQQAVQAAAETLTPGDVVLLSPGGTSFDEFKDFEERGERYRTWVKDLS